MFICKDVPGMQDRLESSLKIKKHKLFKYNAEMKHMNVLLYKQSNVAIDIISIWYCEKMAKLILQNLNF